MSERHVWSLRARPARNPLAPGTPGRGHVRAEGTWRFGNPTPENEGPRSLQAQLRLLYSQRTALATAWKPAARPSTGDTGADGGATA